MLNPSQVSEDAPREAKEEYLSRFLDAMDNGLEAVRALASGGTADLGGLDEYARVIEALHIGIKTDTLTADWTQPTEEDVRIASRPADLARAGASKGELIEAAQRALRLVTDARDLADFQCALYCLEDPALRARHFPQLRRILNRTLALFERGCDVAGFVPGPRDVHELERLVELGAGEDAEEERRQRIHALHERLPEFGRPDRERATSILDASRTR